ncbi:syntaxin-binding protein 6 isoform X2 [Tachysurus ichikawai]
MIGVLSSSLLTRTFGRESASKLGAWIGISYASPGNQPASSPWLWCPPASAHSLVGIIVEHALGITVKTSLYERFLVTNKKPTEISITKVKQFEGSSSFVRRSQWSLDQLRQVNGIDPNRDCPEFDLTFENAFDQWVAGSAGDKCIFVQVLHNTCQRYSAERKPEFVNCQSKLLGGNSILHTAADSVTSAVQKASQALNERGERLGRVEEKTGDMMNSAHQFADTAHKLAMKHKC